MNKSYTLCISLNLIELYQLVSGGQTIIDILCNELKYYGSVTENINNKLFIIKYIGLPKQIKKHIENKKSNLNLMWIKN